MDSIIGSVIKGLTAGSKSTEISDSKSPQAQTGADFKRIVGETLAAEKIRQSGNTLPTAANHAVKVGAETQSGIFDRLGQSVSLDVIDGDSFDLVVIGEKASVEEAMAFGREAGLSSSTISQLFDGDAAKSLASDGRSLPSSGSAAFQALSLQPGVTALRAPSMAAMSVDDAPEAMSVTLSTNDALRYASTPLGAAPTSGLAQQDVAVNASMTAPSALRTTSAPTVPVAETPEAMSVNLSANDALRYASTSLGAAQTSGLAQRDVAVKASMTAPSALSALSTTSAPTIPAAAIPEAMSLNLSTNDALRYGSGVPGSAPEVTVKPNIAVGSDGDMRRVDPGIDVAVTRSVSPNQTPGQAVPIATGLASIGQGDEASRTEVTLAYQLSMQSRSERLSKESGRSAIATKTLEYSKHAESRDPGASVYRPNPTEILVPARSAEMVTAINLGSIATPLSGMHAEPASGLGQVSPLAAEAQRGANLTQFVAQDQQNASVKEQFLSRFSAELAQRFVSKVQDGTYKLEFDLKPRDLGKIEVIMEYRDGKLDAILSSANSVTRDILSEGINRLRDSLMSSGVNLSSLDVASGSERSLRDDTASTGRPAKVAGESGDKLVATTGEEAVAESHVIDFSNLNIDLWV
ncbi:flagellar hook-length control protein FliK [Aequoribacter fuscus]|nr:flagellar hook-length control protein FliK [Aequoribacter fuscus]QHJ89111.1 flagellar hook-length control protein FliK [Aequoribacter fuscus]